MLLDFWHSLCFHRAETLVEKLILSNPMLAVLLLWLFVRIDIDLLWSLNFLMMSVNRLVMSGVSSTSYIPGVQFLSLQMSILLWHHVRKHNPAHVCAAPQKRAQPSKHVDTPKSL